MPNNGTTERGMAANGLQRVLSALILKERHHYPFVLATPLWVDAFSIKYPLECPCSPSDAVFLLLL
jgi:hypothetical protein